MTKVGMPKLIGEVGTMKFLLSDGTETKTFYSVTEFDVTRGQYPILNKDNEIIEYMDILGNFTKGKSEFAKVYYEYYNSIINIPFIRTVSANLMYTGLSEFPSRFLADEKIKKIIIAEEKRRFWWALKNHLFKSLIEALRYKKYVNGCLKDKLTKADIYKQNKEEKLEKDV